MCLEANSRSEAPAGEGTAPPGVAQAVDPPGEPGITREAQGLVRGGPLGVGMAGSRALPRPTLFPHLRPTLLFFLKTCLYR